MVAGNFSLKELQKLPILSGIVELNFENHLFCMINILNDDAVPLKNLGSNSYEKYAMKIMNKVITKINTNVLVIDITTNNRVWASESGYITFKIMFLVYLEGTNMV